MALSRLLLSICIPSFNRASLLSECLSSITNQLDDKSIRNQIEIIVSDNNSQDNTKEIVKKFQNKYKNIRYFKNEATIHGDLNIIKSASYAKGQYLWFFGDDDIHYPWSVKTLLKIINKYHPDAIKCNLDLSSKDGKKMLDWNMINLKKDIFVKTKKELFNFLETKFFMHLDWYLTCQSNTIVSRKLFRDNIDDVMKYYNPETVNFLHCGLIFYNAVDYKIYMISKSLAIYRGYNTRVDFNERRDTIEHLTNWHKVLKLHNNRISKINKKNISFKFKFLLFLKDFTRDIRLLTMKYFAYDVSNILIKLFHKKEL